MELQSLIDRLAECPESDQPFVSVYLDARPDHVGRENYHAFVRTELKALAEQHANVDADVERITTWLQQDARPEANGLAAFACVAAGCFETVQLVATFERSEVVVGRRPHLFPLAAVAERDRRHAAVVLDTRAARLFVFALGEALAELMIESPSLPRTEAGGWSQARHQRHVDEFHRQHAREVARALERLVGEHGIDRVIAAGNDVALPLLRSELSDALRPRVVEASDLDVRAPRDQIRHASLAAVRAQDARDDAEGVRRLLDAHGAGGLGVVGADATLRALANGQVHELLIAADPSPLRARDGRRGAGLANELVIQARRTDARVRFVEDAGLLAEAGGVGGLLRFRVERAA